LSFKHAAYLRNCTTLRERAQSRPARHAPVPTTLCAPLSEPAVSISPRRARRFDLAAPRRARSDRLAKPCQIGFCTPMTLAIEPPALKRLFAAIDADATDEAADATDEADAKRFKPDQQADQQDTPHRQKTSFVVPDVAVEYQKYLRSGVELMKHQVENVARFMANVQSPTLPSSLLVSDDPGLGKTLTAIAAMCALRSVSPPEHKDFKVLVVAPKSVALQWRAEILKFTRTIETNVAVNELNANARITILSYEFIAYKFKQTYERVVEEGRVEWHKRDGVKPSLLFKRGNFKLVVLDEVHKIRNAKTLMHTAMQHVAPPAHGDGEYPRIGLSGTPIVNRPQDLASIANVLKFGEPFDDVKFYARGMIIKKGSGFDHLFLRHLKEHALELPPLLTHTKRLALNDTEKGEHVRWLAKLVGVARLTTAKRATFVELLTALMRLRQVGIHPRLPEITMRMAALKATQRGGGAASDTSDDSEASSDDDEESEESESKESESADPDDESDGASEALVRELSASWEQSSKFSWIVRKLRNQADAIGGVLIFSSFSTPLRALRYVLQDQCGLEAELYIGSCSSSQRAASVRSFLAGHTKVMLLTYGSGGLGLNLCPTATTVIHLDAPWAPASVRQATDRAHRKGATSAVTQVSLVCTDSTDDYIISNIHATKQGHMDALDRLAASLRVRANKADSGLTKKNVMRLIDWFMSRNYTVAAKAPQREA
jgi:SNF2 family DNA or RNA helicase